MLYLFTRHERYEPGSGYNWDFLASIRADDEGTVDTSNLGMRRTRIRRILDNRPPGERTEEEEEGIRATEAIDRILLMLSKSDVVVNGRTVPPATPSIGST